MKPILSLFDLSLKWRMMGFLICKSSSVLSLSFPNFLPSNSLRWSLWTISSFTFMYLKNAAISSTPNLCKFPSLGITRGGRSARKHGVQDAIKILSGCLSELCTLCLFVHVPSKYVNQSSNGKHQLWISFFSFQLLPLTPLQISGNWSPPP